MKKKLLILLLSTVMTTATVSPINRANAKNLIPTAVPLESQLSENIQNVAVLVQEKSVESAESQINEIEQKINEALQKIEFINNTITDKKEWFIQYKNIINEYDGYFDPPESLYDYYSEDELKLFFSVVQCEIGNECYSFEQKVNVANVILNRIENPLFPDTMNEVLIPSQFSTISYIRTHNVEISETVILACEYAFMMPDTTNGALFFDSNSKLKYIKLSSDGAHNFYTSRRALKLKCEGDKINNDNEDQA